MKSLRLISSVFVLLLLCACSGVNKASSAQILEKKIKINGDVIQCNDPRPKICTREFMPVCATKDNGIRCITAPCPSTNKVTYASGCTGCADPAVYSYQLGACKP
jgi:hypothetical protein